MSTAGSQTLSSQPDLKQLENRLKGHVETLALEIGERNIWRPRQLTAAANYIAKTWKSQGYQVKIQAYTARKVPVQNIEIERPGNRKPDEILVIGAHYDTVQGSPGANDNGSGVAALLELSAILASKKPEKTIRFVAFVNEEPPFFKSREMGSRVYAKSVRKNKDKITAMISLETIGYYTDAPGSQSYPFPLEFFYPDTANFIGFVSNLRSFRLINQASDSFRRYSSFPIHKVSAPSLLTGIDWSDHSSFWRYGYPAIMVTDTALFRYHYYHTPADTPDSLVYDKMARVVSGLYHVIADLAGMDVH